MPKFLEPKKKKPKKEPDSRTRSIRFKHALWDRVAEISEEEGVAPNYFVTQCMEFCVRLYEAGGSLTNLPPALSKLKPVKH